MASYIKGQCFEALENKKEVIYKYHFPLGSAAVPNQSPEERE
jgi:hypothetical protein